MSEDFDEVIIAGDFNADPNKGRFFKELKSFSNENSLIIIDNEALPANSYTYVSSNDSGGTSWLDHVLCSSANIVANINISYGHTFDDHIPIGCDINIPVTPVFCGVMGNNRGSLPEKNSYSLGSCL